MPRGDGCLRERMVGAAGFELATPCTPCKCATRLRYAPTGGELYQRAGKCDAKKSEIQARSKATMPAISPRSESAGA